MKFIAIAVTIFAVASGTIQAVPALHKRSGDGLVNVEDVNVEVKDIANDLAHNADVNILSRALVDLTNVDVDVKDINVLSKNHD
ncbi:hypothetical protein BGX24_006867 [Mortierella sp. AD032]|nr:hypothetical protein BGX24_006867 [Mortierella sp. AD032]